MELITDILVVVVAAIVDVVDVDIVVVDGVTEPNVWISLIFSIKVSSFFMNGVLLALFVLVSYSSEFE